MFFFKKISALTLVFILFQSNAYSETVTKDNEKENNPLCNSEPYNVSLEGSKISLFEKRNIIIKALPVYHWDIKSLTKNEMTAIYDEDNFICIHITDEATALTYKSKTYSDHVRHYSEGRKFKKWFRSLDKEIQRRMKIEKYLNLSKSIANSEG